MATYTAVVSTVQTLAGSAVDTVTLTGGHRIVEVLNQAASATLYTSWDVAATPADPAVDLDGVIVVPAGGSVLVNTGAASGDRVVKVAGNGQAYAVRGTHS